MSHSWGASCKDLSEAEDGPDIKQYMSTGLVARDMLQIVEKHASLVAEKLAQRCPKMMASHEVDTALYKPEEAKLQYWGFSYGTFLGSTFASMFPDRVGRVILDGVVSSYDYNHSLGNGSLTDNQKAMDSFNTWCVSAGPGACPLTTVNSTISDVKDRVESIVESLYHNPLALQTPIGPDILTYSDIKNFLFSAGYSPQATFSFAAALLADIEAGSGPLIDAISGGFRYTHVYACPVNGSQPVMLYTDSVPTFAILCGDGIDQTHVTIDEFAQYWEMLENMAPSSGAIWSMLNMRCTSWKIKASYKFEGEFGGNTSNPILFLSNTADPVTPLRSGRIMHNLFPNSGILVSDHAGHCSIAQPNLCLLSHIKMYFQTGMLPPENTLCVPPQSPWSLNSTDPKSPFYDPSLEGMTIEQAMSAEERGDTQNTLARAGWDVARQIVGQDWFGVARLVGGNTKGRELLKMAAQEMQMY